MSCVCLRWVVLRCFVLHFVELRCIMLRFVELRMFALSCVTLFCVAFRWVTLRSVVLRCIMLRLVELRMFALSCVSLCYVVLCCVSLSNVRLYCVTCLSVLRFVELLCGKLDWDMLCFVWRASSCYLDSCNNCGLCMVLWSVRERCMAQYRWLQLSMFSVRVTPPLASGWRTCPGSTR